MIEITRLQENEDGTADCSFVATQEGKEALFRYGILALLKEAIAQGNKLEPTETENTNGQ
jgi:hypothetical protein